MCSILRDEVSKCVNAEMIFTWPLPAGHIYIFAHSLKVRYYNPVLAKPVLHFIITADDQQPVFAVLFH